MKNLRLILSIVILFSITSGISFADQQSKFVQLNNSQTKHLSKDISSILADPILASGIDGVVIADVKSGQTLFELNPDRLLIPASNRKLFTAAAALGRLGPDYVERTTVSVDGTVVNGHYSPTVDSLILRGGEDPLLTSGELDSLAADIAAKGIKTVRFGVVVDDSLFDNQGDPWGDGWQADTLLDYYSPEISALEVDEGICTISLKGGAKEGDPTTFTVSPITSYFTIDNQATTGSPRSAVNYSLTRTLTGTAIKITGSIPPNSSPDPNDDDTDGRITLPSPPLYAGTIFTECLKAHGVAVNTAPVLGKADPDSVVAASHDSVPLSQLLALMLKPSDNLVAENLTRLEGLSSDSPTTYDKGAAAEDEWLKSVGIGPETHKFADGSGESRDDFVTSKAVVDLLLVMAKRPDFPIFYNALSIVGKDGTAKDRMAGTLASDGNAHVKTGTVRYCRALSGYVTGKNGEMFAFSILMNNHLISAHKMGLVQDKIVERLAEE